MNAQDSIGSSDGTSHTVPPIEELIGQSQIIGNLREYTARVAETDCRVLITGEPGTEKLLLAQSIHRQSLRRNQPFQPIVCATLTHAFWLGIPDEPAGAPPPSSHGHAFHSLAALHRGTVFFDEVGNLSADNQAKLLRVLLEEEVGTPDMADHNPTDSRIISATSRDLRQDIAVNRFRADLYYRLNVVPLRIPPLRERLEDLPMLSHHFVKKFAGKYGKPITGIPEHCFRKLCEYSWPNNVQELETLIELEVIHSTGSSLIINPPAERVINTPQSPN